MITDLPSDVILCIGLQLDKKKDIVNYFSVLGHKLGRLELDEVARMLDVPYSDKLEKLIEYASTNIGGLVPEFLRQGDIRILRFQCGVNLVGLPTQYPRVAREVFSNVQKYQQFRRDIFRDIILKENFGMLKVVLEQENVGDLLGTLVSTLSHKLEELSFLILEDGRCLKEERAYFTILKFASKFRALGVLDFCLLFAHFPSKEISENELRIIATSMSSSNSRLVAKRISRIFPHEDSTFFENACLSDCLKLTRYFFERGNITRDEVEKVIREIVKCKASKVFTYLYDLYSWKDKLKNELLVEALECCSFDCFVLLLEKGADPSYNENAVLHCTISLNRPIFLKRIVVDNRVREECLRTSEVYDMVQVLGDNHCEVVSILFSEGILSPHNSCTLLWASSERNNYKLTSLYIDKGVVLPEVKLRNLIQYTHKNDYRKTRAQLMRLWKSYNQTSYIECLAEHGCYDLLREIIQDDSKKYISRGNALQLAIEGDYIRITRLLLKNTEVDRDILCNFLENASKKMTRLLQKFS